MLEGQLLNERYLIKHIIGGGGMAHVYEAHDYILNRDVAIKVLKMEYADDAEFIERFDREAQAATSLSHPNVVNIYDVGEENKIMFIVMELVEGMTLKEYIQKYGPLQVDEAVRIMMELTSAINHAHENDLIHRDIKPQNILIDENGTVKVTDFGIAIALSATALTQTNSILGSVHYLSPEQARGGVATKKSDIYSLGIVFYELLTGKLAFSGETAVSIALKHLQGETPSVREFNSDIPQSVENIIMQATDKDPLARYASVTEMENALFSCLSPEKMNEAIYQSPSHTGEETKAIPLYNELNGMDDLEKTILPNEDETTKKIPPVKEGMTKKPKKKKPWKKILLILLIIGVLIGIAVSVFIILKPKNVTIPDVVGLEYDEAKEELEALNLKTDRELIHSDEVEEGLIVKTDPKASRTLKEESTVTLFVSEGEEPIEMKDYVGKKFDQTEKVLKDKGFSDIIEYEKNSDEPVGEIITQIQPKAGMEVVPSKTSVIFEISLGPDSIVLDDLNGKSMDYFSSYADKHRLEYDIIEEYSDTIAENDIIKQNPSPGAEVEVGSKVTVTVSKGQKEPESKPYSETFTVPFDSDGDKEQNVKIYVDDLENDLTNVFEEDTITKDKEYTIDLKIEKDRTAEYKVERDGKKIMEDTISYEEGS